MTQDQKKRLKPLLKKLMMEVKSELREENTNLDGELDELRQQIFYFQTRYGMSDEDKIIKLIASLDRTAKKLRKYLSEM